MVTLTESFSLVVYDVVNDRIRHRISEACLDFGLERFQMSAFWGYLSATRRKDLFDQMRELLGQHPGRILIQPVGAEDFQRRLVLHQKAEKEAEKEKPAKKHREFGEPGKERPSIVKL